MQCLEQRKSHYKIVRNSEITFIFDKQYVAKIGFNKCGTSEAKMYIPNYDVKGKEE